jgi:drug/metabolite transporter (DMT)-like permease
LAHAAAAAAALCAGTAVVATRFVIGETDPISLVFYRYLISIICFEPALPALWPRDGLDAMEFAKIAMFGILFFVLFPWAFNAALQYNPAARGAVGLATIPIQTLLVAAVFGREKLTGQGPGVALASPGSRSGARRGHGTWKPPLRRPPHALSALCRCLLGLHRRP